jgi:hypothetical protein
MGGSRGVKSRNGNVRRPVCSPRRNTIVGNDSGYARMNRVQLFANASMFGVRIHELP